MLIPRGAIDSKEVKGMIKAVNYLGVYGGYMVNFRDLEETYFLSVGYVENFVKAGERKSIPVEFFRDHGIRIPSEKKRTLYRYDLSSWLKRYEMSVEVSMR